MAFNSFNVTAYLPYRHQKVCSQLALSFLEALTTCSILFPLKLLCIAYDLQCHTALSTHLSLVSLH
jgi:hypothetical protein